MCCLLPHEPRFHVPPHPLPPSLPPSLPSAHAGAGDNETIFQIYFPAKTIEENWGTLTADEGRRQCIELAEKLGRDGWDETLLAPLREAETVIRVGLFAREPLDTWCAAGGRVVLLGDAAHPPVPYIGQGAMMAMEDVGVLSHLLRHYCCAAGAAPFEPSDANLAAAAASYQLMRIARTRKILGSSHTLGKTQQLRADSWLYNLRREWTIYLQVLLHGTLPIMKPGAAYDYAADVARHVSPEAADAAEADTKAASPAAAALALLDKRRPLVAGAVVATAAAAMLLLRRR